MTLMCILDQLNVFARQNTFLSILILGIIANLLTSLTKILVIASYSLGTRFISKKSRQSIQFYIEHLEQEILQVEKIYNKETDILFELVSGIYDILVITAATAFTYLLSVWLSPEKGFYIFLGASAWMIKRIIGILYFYHSLISKADDFNNYRLKTENKIQLYKKLIN